VSNPTATTATAMGLTVVSSTAAQRFYQALGDRRSSVRFHSRIGDLQRVLGPVQERQDFDGLPKVATRCPWADTTAVTHGLAPSMLLATFMGPGVCLVHGTRFVALWANAGVYGDGSGWVRQGVGGACWSPDGPAGSVRVARLGGLSGFPAGGGLRGPHGVNGRPARGEPTAELLGGQPVVRLFRREGGGGGGFSDGGRPGRCRVR
jgi:hypothetical protein